MENEIRLLRTFHLQLEEPSFYEIRMACCNLVILFQMLDELDDDEKMSRQCGLVLKINGLVTLCLHVVDSCDVVMEGIVFKMLKNLEQCDLGESLVLVVK